jgi:methylthioribose-1-phosphate isomerase
MMQEAGIARAVLSYPTSDAYLYLCPPTSKAESGQDIKIEVRPDKEMLKFRGIPLAPKGIKGYYPAFDITPHNLISKHIYLEL